MQMIQFELANDVYQTLERMAQENDTDPTTLVRTQVERLVITYQGGRLTSGLEEHLADSIDEHRSLLHKLAA